MSQRGPSGPTPTPARRYGQGAGYLLAVVGLVGLALDTALETFLAGSPWRMAVLGAAMTTLVVTALAVRRFGWPAAAATALVLSFASIAATAWLPAGQSHGVVIARQPTPVVLAAVSLVVLALALAVVLRLRTTHLLLRVLMGLLAIYAAVAYGLGIAARTSYADLFHGDAFWSRLPPWVQGPVVGSLGLVPAALLVHLVLGIRRTRGAQWRGWSVQALVLGMGLALALAGLRSPRQAAVVTPPTGAGATASPAQTRAMPPAGPVKTPSPAATGAIPAATEMPSPAPSGPPPLTGGGPSTGVPGSSPPSSPTGAPGSPPGTCLVQAPPPSPAASRPGPRIVQAYIAYDESGARPLYTVAPDAPAVYAVWRAEGVTAGTEVRARWIAERGTGNAAQTVLATSTRRLQQDGQPWGAFSLARPAGGWKPGAYRVELDAGGRPWVAGFVVQGQHAGPGTPVSPGVVVRYFADHSYNFPRRIGVTATIALEWETPPVAPRDGHRFWVEWEGILQVSVAGQYQFAFAGDGEGFLYLDGRRVGPSSPELFPALAAGAHTIRVGALQHTERGRFVLLWRTEAVARLRDFAPIDARLLGHTEAQRAWRRTPRQAAQVGLEWLQSAAVTWQRTHRCFGCHVQGQVVAGLATAKANGYTIDEDVLQELVQLIRNRQEADGSYEPAVGAITATQYAASALARYAPLTRTADDETLARAVDWLLARQKPTGEVPLDHAEPPIDQGSILTTANAAAVFALRQAQTGDQHYGQAVRCALNWIASSTPTTTQDLAHAVAALAPSTQTDDRTRVRALAARLLGEQTAEGGWKEAPSTEGANAFATGQALCALRDAGIASTIPEFQRAVRFLLSRQGPDGAWPAERTTSHRPSPFAHTMWPVICLASTAVEVAPEPDGQLQVTTNVVRTRPTRRVEFVVDLSGSMALPLGNRTRWQTALDVFQQVLAVLPGDLHVGLRVYGHRYPSTSPLSCQDTELLVPIARLDRSRLVAALRGLRPRGETPLVFSVLQAANDLKTAGGGSIVLITDGEESCRGDLARAVAHLRATGVDITLNIVGFTLKGQEVQKPLAALAGATGGHYYGAQSGEALARALLVAAIDRIPYKVFDAAGKLVAVGAAGDFVDHLPPGAYRVVVQAADQVLTADVSVEVGRPVILAVVLRGERFALERR